MSHVIQSERTAENVNNEKVTVTIEQTNSQMEV